jgi:hypothetical protein
MQDKETSQKIGSVDKKSSEMSATEKTTYLGQLFGACVAGYAILLSILSYIADNHGVPRLINYLVTMTIVIVLAKITSRKIYNNKFGDK